MIFAFIYSYLLDMVTSSFGFCAGLHVYFVG